MVFLPVLTLYLASVKLSRIIVDDDNNSSNTDTLHEKDNGIIKVVIIN